MKTVKLALLIDDDRIDRRYYRRTIEKSGLVEELIEFPAADEALAYLKANPDKKVDVIFLDINMPRMNGFEFLDEATKEFGTSFVEIVVAMITTSLNPADRERAESYDIIKEFIVKPLTDEHVSRVASYLE